MKTLNDYFSKIYCINLDKRTDKYKDCLKEFKKIGIEVERVSAIDGTPIFKPGLNTKAGAYGLFLTNLNIIQNALTNNYKNILILEDDVMFIDNFNELFNEKIESLPDDWHLLYLGGNNYFELGKFNLVTGDRSFKVTKENYRKLNHEICKTTWTQTTHAMAINSSHYRLLLSGLARHSTVPIDRAYCYLQREGACNAYTFLPSLALQRPTISDIEGIYIDYNNRNHNF